MEVFRASSRGENSIMRTEQDSVEIINSQHAQVDENVFCRSASANCDNCGHLSVDGDHTNSATVTGAVTILILSGFYHRIWLLLSGADLAGPVSPRKPALFGISAGITIWSLSLISRHLHLVRGVRLASHVIAISLLAEVALITLQFHRGVGPVPVRWVARHTEYDPPRLFVDRQESGPFADWVHCHQFLSDGQGGTILRDEVNYTVPFGILGQWLGGWFVRRKLEAMFAYRHEVTKRLVESGDNAVRPEATALLSKGAT
ncbi:MAG: hypothetical protein AB7V46_24905 [Thermomicrobiales bacterium]